MNLDEEGGFSFDFGPGDSLLVMFDKNKRGNEWKPLPTTGVNRQDLTSNWDVEFRYSLEDTVKKELLASKICQCFKYSFLCYLASRL